MFTLRVENLKIGKKGEGSKAIDFLRPLIDEYKRHKVKAKLQHFSNDSTAILPS